MPEILLTIDNMDRLPDGGPTTFRAGRRSFTIGRALGQDWTLPDDDAQISRSHCEINFEDGGYWLRDTSTNGTYLNDETDAIPEPRALRDGDRLHIGHYVVTVEISGIGDKGASGPDERQEPPTGKGRRRPSWLSGPEGRPEPAAKRWTKSEPADDPADGGESDITHMPGSARQQGRQAEEAERDHAASPLAPDGPEPADAGDWESFVTTFVAKTGVSSQVIRHLRPKDMADLLASLTTIATARLMGMLKARWAAKSLMRQTRQTIIQATGNNPLKFSPDAQHALALMLGPRTATGAFVEAAEAFSESFDDLEEHQETLFEAMRQAIDRLARDFDPGALTNGTPPGTLAEALPVVRKARLWDRSVARWQRLSTLDDGIEGLFWRYFGEAYATATKRKGRR